MKAAKYVWAHLAKDYKLESKDGLHLSQLLVYMVASVFICFIAFQRIQNPQTWSALFWLLLLFGAFQVCGRSFDRDTRGRIYWLYLTGKPAPVIWAKWVLNTVLLSILGMITLLLFRVAFEWPMQQLHIAGLLLCVWLGSMALASALTLTSAISFKAGNALGLTAILGFPVVLPTLLIAIKATQLALNNASWSAMLKYHGGLLALTGVGIALSVLLFPYFWRD